jgi:DNA-binding NarL/FixJ family response regulator
MVLVIHISAHLSEPYYHLGGTAGNVFEFFELKDSQAQGIPDIHSNVVPDQLRIQPGRLWIVHFGNAEIAQLLSDLQGREQCNQKNYYWIAYSSRDGNAPSDFPQDPHFCWATKFQSIKERLPKLVEEWAVRLADQPSASPKFSLLHAIPTAPPVAIPANDDPPPTDAGVPLKLWLYDPPDGWADSLASELGATVTVNRPPYSVEQFLSKAMSWQQEKPDALLLFLPRPLPENALESERLAWIASVPERVEWIKHLRFDLNLDEVIRHTPVLFFAENTFSELSEILTDAYFLQSPGCKLLPANIAWNSLRRELAKLPHIQKDEQLEYFARAELSHLEEARAHLMKNRIGPLVLLKGYLLRDWEKEGEARNQMLADAGNNIISQMFALLSEEEAQYLGHLEKIEQLYGKIDAQQRCLDEVANLKSQMLCSQVRCELQRLMTPFHAQTSAKVKQLNTTNIELEKLAATYGAEMQSNPEVAALLQRYRDWLTRMCGRQSRNGRIGIPRDEQLDIVSMRSSSMPFEMAQLEQQQIKYRQALRQLLTQIPEVAAQNLAEAKKELSTQIDTAINFYDRLLNKCRLLIVNNDIRSKATLFLDRHQSVAKRNCCRIPPIPQFGKAKLLYIDDDADKGWADVLQLIFDTDALHVHCPDSAENYQYVANILRNSTLKSYDLVLLDLWLKPDEDQQRCLLNEEELYSGMKILRIIQKQNPNIPVIVFSAADQGINYQRLIAQGAYGFYFKGGIAVFNDPMLCQYNFGLLLQLMRSCQVQQEHRQIAEAIEKLQKPERSYYVSEQWQQIVAYFQARHYELRRIGKSDVSVSDLAGFLVGLEFLQDVLSRRELLNSAIVQGDRWNFTCRFFNIYSDHPLRLFLQFSYLLRDIAAHERVNRKFLHLDDCLFGFYCQLQFFRHLGDFLGSERPDYQIRHNQDVGTSLQPWLSLFNRYIQQDPCANPGRFFKHDREQPWLRDPEAGYPAWRLLFCYLIFAYHSYSYLSDKMKEVLCKRLCEARIVPTNDERAWEIQLNDSLLAGIAATRDVEPGEPDSAVVYFWPAAGNDWLSGYKPSWLSEQIQRLQSEEQKSDLDQRRGLHRQWAMPEGRFVYLTLETQEQKICLRHIADEPPQIFRV